MVDRVFSKLEKNRICVLKIPDDAITDEFLPKANTNTALYKTNIAVVERIFNVEKNKDYIDGIMLCVNAKQKIKKLKCVVGNRIEFNYIYYYKTLEPALYYGIDLNRYTGDYKEWYDNGNLYIEYKLFNGLPNGSYYEYEENGNIKYSCNYKHGKLDGDYEEYKNNRLILRTNFINGINEGLTCLYENGKLIEKYYVKNKVMHGEYKKFDNNDVVVKCNYVDGKLCGEYIILKNKLPIRQATFNNDKIVGQYVDIEYYEKDSISEKQLTEIKETFNMEYKDIGKYIAVMKYL